MESKLPPASFDPAMRNLWIREAIRRCRLQVGNLASRLRGLRMIGRALKQAFRFRLSGFRIQKRTNAFRFPQSKSNHPVFRCCSRRGPRRPAVEKHHLHRRRELTTTRSSLQAPRIDLGAGCGKRKAETENCLPRRGRHATADGRAPTGLICLIFLFVQRVNAVIL